MDCIDRTDESNCPRPSFAPFKDVFKLCTINEQNKFDKSSQIGWQGFECGKFCLDLNNWCSPNYAEDTASFRNLSQICNDLMIQSNTFFVCTNTTFWEGKPCNGQFKRCTGNIPGQCIPSDSKDAGCKDKSDKVNAVSEFSRECVSSKKPKTDSISDKPRDLAVAAIEEQSKIGPVGIKYVHEESWCNGKIDCENGADEDDEICSICPRDFGFPPNRIKFATFSCRHRHTKRWICAVPCDGLDDFCENSEDENCSVPTWKFTLSSLFILMLFTVLFGQIVYYFEYGNYTQKSDISITCNFLTETLRACGTHYDDIHYLSLFSNIHAGEDYFTQLQGLTDYVNRINDRVEFSQITETFLKLEFQHHQKNVKETLLCFKKNINTNERLRIFLPFVKSARHINSQIWQRISENVKTIQESKHKFVILTFHILVSMTKMLFYYLDFIKDIFLIFLLLRKVQLKNTFDTFEIQIAFLTLVSIILPQIIIRCVMIYLTFKQKVYLKSGILMSETFFVIPAIAFYVIGRLNANMEASLNKKTVDDTLTWRKRCALFKMIESCFETSVQMIILIVVIFLKHSITKNVHGLENVISNNEVGLLAFSALWSLFSITFTEIQWRAASKNFRMEISGMFLYGLMTFVSVVKRTFAIVIYFAPVFGFFNLMGHISKVELVSSKTRIFYSVESNGTRVEFQEKWRGIKHYSELTGFNLKTYFIFMIVFILCHFGMILVTKYSLAINFKEKKNVFKKIFHILIQLFCPKIYQDWDEHVSTVDEAIKNYERVKKEFKAMLALFMIGDLLLCAPIWLLSYNIYNRNVFLYEFFPPNEKEIISTKISYILSFACPIFFIIAPLLQYGLFILYNRFGHPWCELLQSNPTGPHVFHTYELEMEDILKTENGAHEQLNMDS